MPPAITKKSIAFPNNREATAVFPLAGTTGVEIVKALEVRDYKGVILLIGGADSVAEDVKARLTQLFGRGIARAAVSGNAVVVDGGTAAGVMQMMGEGVADRGFKSSLIGVAPLGLVNFPGSEGRGETPLDPNHSHFVLVEGNVWGSETGVMYKLVSALTSNKAPAVVLLVGGGAVSTDETLQAVRQNLPLFVVEGSGGLADEVATAWKARPELPEDPVMAEIIADGRIQFHLLTNSVKGAERLILHELAGSDVLLDAWENFADYDLNAILQQKSFDKLQLPILLIGVLVTALTLTHQVFAPKDINVYFPNVWWWVRQLLIIIPILLTILITVANRFKHGNKWLLLRASAEAIKREIYRYRTRTFPYGESSPDAPSPEQQLSRKIQDITQSAMETEAGLSALVPYDKTKGFPPYMGTLTGDDGFSILSPERYIEIRLVDQLSYYRRKAVKIERRWKAIQVLIVVVGGVGSYLALVGQQVWIALTTSIVAALTSSIGYKLSENDLMKYNRATTELAGLKRWWATLPAQEQARPANANVLVEYTEEVLKSELDNWIQLKQSAIAELVKKQTLAADRSGAPKPRDSQEAEEED